MQHLKKTFQEKGFAIINDLFSAEEISSMLSCIEKTDPSKDTFRKSADLFAIRQCLIEITGLSKIIFEKKLNSLIDEAFGADYFVVKSIYFDKPEQSNWFVSYHQDLTISVNKKLETEGYSNWTVKQGQFAVQPPLDILESNFTIRIHLDHTDRNNGALKVIPGSHKKGICRPGTIDWSAEQETICKVGAGGIMLMSPLLLHASDRTTNDQKRRVIHIEFSDKKLAAGLTWSEFMERK
jgi:ectoine hydroxylase-related dioxygenase (phytanoyl-CoA dioxygenase family)